MNFVKSTYYAEEKFESFCFDTVIKKNIRPKIPYAIKVNNETFIADLGYFLRTNFPRFWLEFDPKGEIFNQSTDIFLSRTERINYEMIFYEFIAIFDCILFLKKEIIKGFAFFAMMYENFVGKKTRLFSERKGAQQGREYYGILTTMIKSLLTGDFNKKYLNNHKLVSQYNKLFSNYISNRSITIPTNLPYNRLSDYYLVTQFNKFIENILIMEIINDFDSIASSLKKSPVLSKITLYFPMLKKSISTVLQSEKAQCVYTPMEFASALLFYLNGDIFRVISKRLTEYSFISIPRLHDIVQRKKRYFQKMFDEEKEKTIREVNSTVIKKLTSRITPKTNRIVLLDG